MVPTSHVPASFYCQWGSARYHWLSQNAVLGSATFAAVQEDPEASFRLRLKVYDNLPAARRSRCIWDHSGSVWTFTSVGPDEREATRVQAQGEDLINQAMFIKTVNIALSDNEWKRLEDELALMVRASEDSRQSQSKTSTLEPTIQKPRRSSQLPRFTGLGRRGKRPTAQGTQLSASFSSESQSDSSDSSEDLNIWNSDSEIFSSDGFSIDELPLQDEICDETKWRGIVSDRYPQGPRCMHVIE